MKKVLIWGAGKSYTLHYNLIKYFEKLHQYEVVGITTNDVPTTGRINEYMYVGKGEIAEGGVDFDYVLVALEKPREIISEAGCMNISSDKLIPISVLDIPFFDFDKYVKIRENRISIVSQMCFGGILYHRLGMKFLSPTVNLFFNEGDFVKLTENFENYMSLEVRYLKEGFNDFLNREYPVGYLKDIEIHFNHDTDFMAAKDKWVKRRERINYEKLLFVSYTENEETADRLSSMEGRRQLIFTSFKSDIPNTIYLQKTNKYSGNFGMMVNDLANGYRNDYSILDLLEKNI